MRVGSGSLSNPMCGSVDLRRRRRRTVTCSKLGHGFTLMPAVLLTRTRSHAPSFTHHVRSVSILLPRSVCTVVKPGQAVACVHSRQFWHTSCVTFMCVFFGR